MLPEPKKPVYQSVPSQTSWLAGKGIGAPGPAPKQDCGAKPVKPSCNPTKVIAPVGPKPTCTPPEIPPMPVKPDCKRPLLGIGQNGLIVAGLATAAVLFALKKKKN
jgi:hypothetical protein